ncbi:TIGR03843 family protein, putative phosphatidylinositol kinase [Candidatus Planktophila lacus]|uniref:SCO1664 family protein n=1 Tax=Candidatus Planktophila lacus TaxID=1884913 RepID=UPI000BAC557F|nr:SCO1664 family protein [Candidatus Planktophila lacus]ASY29037.1 TIGR03843 family protein, putative phosphatidylinositol kinase [Candidatus Planktophila lacus]
MSFLGAQEIEEYLRDLSHGEISVTGRLVDASNATLYASCEVKERTLICIYKPIAGERPLWDFPDGTLANREYLTFLVSHWLGLHLVPPTVLRDGPYGTGMVQLWIDIDESVDLMEFFKEDHAELRKIALLDLITNNTDRKIGHLIPTSEGAVYGCDHGVTFHAEDKLRTVLWQWAKQPFSPAELELLQLARMLIATEKRDVVLGLIEEEELDATVDRIDRALTEKCFPEPNPDWPAVPWPPF